MSSRTHFALHRVKLCVWFGEVLEPHHVAFALVIKWIVSNIIVSGAKLSVVSVWAYKYGTEPPQVVLILFKVAGVARWGLCVLPVE